MTKYTRDSLIYMHFVCVWHIRCCYSKVAIRSQQSTANNNNPPHALPVTTTNDEKEELIFPIGPHSHENEIENELILFDDEQKQCLKDLRDGKVNNSIFYGDYGTGSRIAHVSEHARFKDFICHFKNAFEIK